MISRFKKSLKNSPRLYILAQRLYPFFTVFPGLLRRRRGSWEHLRSTWSLVFRSKFVSGRPINITIEPTNLCNLRCPVCETGQGELGRSDRQMTLAEFKTIISKVCVHTNTLIFYFMGEPFLNREAYQMISYAKDSGIPWVTTCTNGESIDPRQLVNSKLDEVNFQIGGMSQETHQVYRVNGNLERVLHNLKETVRLKQESGVKLRITCGLILMRHNEHEVELFKQTMKEISLDEVAIIDPCVRNVEQARFYLPSDEKRWYYDPQAFRAGTLRPRLIPKNSCPWIYYSMAIQANGDVVPCCRDARGKHIMGNLLNQSFKSIWNGERYLAFRREILNNQSQMNICSLCSGYPASALK